MDRRGGAPAEEGQAMFAKVVVGADASETAAEAVRSAMELAQRFESELHIVTAFKPKSARGGADKVPEEFRFSLLTNPADVLLTELANRAKQYGLDPTVHASTASPADAIVKVATEEEADLIVVGNKGMHGTHRVLGSVPNSVAHEAPCAVLIVATTQ
jgi:nucleotide-binding universal stress UspA family protein